MPDVRIRLTLLSDMTISPVPPMVCDPSTFMSVRPLVAFRFHVPLLVMPLRIVVSNEVFWTRFDPVVIVTPSSTGTPPLLTTD